MIYNFKKIINIFLVICNVVNRKMDVVVFIFIYINMRLMLIESNRWKLNLCYKKCILIVYVWFFFNFLNNEYYEKVSDIVFLVICIYCKVFVLWYYVKRMNYLYYCGMYVINMYIYRSFGYVVIRFLMIFI